MREAGEVLRSVRRLYRDVEGYTIDEDGGQALAAAAGSSLLYGELGLAATVKLMQALEPEPDSVLWDLGCGVGKVVMVAALLGPWRRVVGVELSPERATRAAGVQRAAKAEGLPGAERASFMSGDFMRRRLRDATHVYSCSTAFPDPLMRRLSEKLAAGPEGRVFASLRPLCEDDPYFRLEQRLRLDTSWRRREAVHIYRLTHPRR